MPIKCNMNVLERRNLDCFGPMIAEFLGIFPSFHRILRYGTQSGIVINFDNSEQNKPLANHRSNFCARDGICEASAIHSIWRMNARRFRKGWEVLTLYFLQVNFMFISQEYEKNIIWEWYYVLDVSSLRTRQAAGARRRSCIRRLRNYFQKLWHEFRILHRPSSVSCE